MLWRWTLKLEQYQQLLSVLLLLLLIMLRQAPLTATGSSCSSPGM
jgi:hypothetical protein